MGRRSWRLLLAAACLLGCGSRSSLDETTHDRALPSGAAIGQPGGVINQPGDAVDQQRVDGSALWWMDCMVIPVRVGSRLTVGTATAADGELEIVDEDFRLVEAPDGSRAVFIVEFHAVGPASEQRGPASAVLFPDVPGTYIVEHFARDAQGFEQACEIVVVADPARL